jgi:UDP-GlcNAc:undecaprenyl-phosphate GlcNAc-1-phosphate transferase
MLLGVLMAAATISGVGRNPYPPSGGDLAAFAIPVLVPVIVLAVPFVDVGLAIIRRIRKGRPVTHPDKEHIHHRLMEIGHSHRVAVLLMYLWSALISLAVLAVALINGRLIVSVILLATLVVMLATVVPRMRWRGGPNGKAEARPAAATAKMSPSDSTAAPTQATFGTKDPSA